MSFWLGLFGVGDSSQESGDDSAVSEAAQAHLGRNDYQAGLAPDHLPPDFPYHDPRTGMTWERDHPVSESIWHGIDNDCMRAPMPDPVVDDLRQAPHYRADFAALSGDEHYAVDTTVPGAQACYGADGHLIDHGPHQGTFDYATPINPGQSDAHWHMDVVPDFHTDAYAPADDSGGDVHAHLADHQDGFEGWGGGHGAPGADLAPHAETDWHDTGSIANTDASAGYDGGAVAGGASDTSSSNE